MEHGRPKASQAALTRAHYQRRALSAAFLAWVEFIREQRQAALDASDARLSFLGVKLGIWRHNSREQRRERDLERRAAAARSVFLTRRGWDGFRQLAEARRATLRARAEADALRRAALQRTALLAWRQGAQIGISQRAQRAQQEQAAQALLLARQERLVWGVLSLWAAAAADARRRAVRLEAFAAAATRRAVRRVFQAWRVEALDSLLAQSRHEGDALESELERSQQQLQSRAAEAAEAARSVVTVSLQAERLVVRVASLTAELAVAAQRAAEMQQDLGAAAQRRDAAAAAEAEGRVACAVAQSMASAAAHAASEAQEHVAAAEARAQHAAEAAAESQADAVAARSEAVNANNAWEGEREALRSARAECAAATGRCEALSADAARLAQELEQAQAALAGVQQRLEAAEAAVPELTARLGRAQRQLDREREASAAASSQRAEAVRQAGQLAAVCEGQERAARLAAQAAATELAAREEHWQRERLALQQELQRSSGVLDSFREALLARAAEPSDHPEAGQQPAPAEEAPASPAPLAGSSGANDWPGSEASLAPSTSAVAADGASQPSGTPQPLAACMLSPHGSVSGRRLAFLLDLVVSGKMTTSEAQEVRWPLPPWSCDVLLPGTTGLACWQLTPVGLSPLHPSPAQVITAAAEGDVRPLLSVLQMAKRGAAGSPQVVARAAQTVPLADRTGA